MANPATKTNTTAPAAKRVAPEITAISSNVAMPAKVNNRGSKSVYPFDALGVGQSFGVKNKTAKDMASIVSNANRSKANFAQKVDAEGKPVFKTNELKAPDGSVTHVPTQEPEMVQVKKFFAVDTDPKTDPDGVSVRVFRQH